MKAFKSLACIIIALFALSVFTACNNMGGLGGSENNGPSIPKVEEYTVSVEAPHNSWKVSYDTPIRVKTALSYDNVDPFDYAICKDGELIGPFYTIKESCSITLKRFDELELSTQIDFTLSYDGANTNESALIPENCTVDFLIMYYLMSSTVTTADVYGMDAETLVILLNYLNVFDITVNGNEVDGSYVIQAGDAISVIEREVTYTVIVSFDGKKMKFNGYGTAFNFETVLMILGYNEQSYSYFYQIYDVKIDGKVIEKGNIIIDKDCVVELSTKKTEQSGSIPTTTETSSNKTSSDDSITPPENDEVFCKKCESYYEPSYICNKCFLCLNCCHGHYDDPVDPNPNEINVTIIINHYDGTQLSFSYEASEPIPLKKALHYTENDNYTTEEYKYFWMINYTYVDMDYMIYTDTVVTYVPSGFGWNVTYYEDAYMTENGPESNAYGNVVPVPEMYLKEFIRFLGYDFKSLASQGYWMINNKVVTDPEFIVSMESSSIYYIYGDPEGDTSDTFTVSFMVDGFAVYREFTQPVTAREAATAHGIDITNYDLFINGVQISEEDVISYNCTIYLKEKTDGCKHEKYDPFFTRVCDTTNCDHNYCYECGVVFARIYDAVGNYNDVICSICTAYVHQGDVNLYKCKQCGNEFKEGDLCKECGLCPICCTGHGDEGDTYRCKSCDVVCGDFYCKQCGLCPSCCMGHDDEEENTFYIQFICEENDYTHYCSYYFEKEVAIAVAATACGIDWTQYDIYLDGKLVEDSFVVTNNVTITLVRKSDEGTSTCQHANCTYYNPVCEMANHEHYYCYDCQLVVYRVYDADGKYVSISCEKCTAHANNGGDDPSASTYCEVTFICGELVMTYAAKTNVCLKDFIVMAEGLGYEYYESHTFTIDGKEIDGSFVITQNVTIIVS